MYYKFNMTSEQSLYNELDFKEFEENFYEILKNEFNIDARELTNAQFSQRLRQIVKNELKFILLINKLELNVKTVIYNLVSLYPDVFTDHVIKYIKQTYLNNDFESLIELSAL